MSKPAPASSLQQISDALADVVLQAAQSVVAVHSSRLRSSGFLWRPGLVVTADEALAEEGDISIALPNGETAAAILVGRDPANGSPARRRAELANRTVRRLSQLGKKFSAWLPEYSLAGQQGNGKLQNHDYGR